MVTTSRGRGTRTSADSRRRPHTRGSAVPAPAGSPVEPPVPAPIQAIVRIRLATAEEPETFETWLRQRPFVTAAWALSGDHDYEVRLACPALRELTAELRCIRQHGGAEETTTCLLLRDVLETFEQ